MYAAVLPSALMRETTTIRVSHDSGARLRALRDNYGLRSVEVVVEGLLQTQGERYEALLRKTRSEAIAADARPTPV